ncbi:glycosyltransferase [Albidovulum sp.]|uniref:glycosyltransferase n=1 Tax=Albidovulum sp. TaxID=1872424 RepID=UPI003D7EFD14
MKEALVVLGMHRSGTSFLVGALSALGHALPRDRQPGGADNRHGHFEPGAVVALNDLILAAGGGRWDQAGPFDPGVARAALPDIGPRIRAALDASFGSATRVVIKDPRLSLTFPLWRTEMEAMGVTLRVLIALRHPLAVAQSLARRNGCPPDLAALSWLAHSIAAIEASHGLNRTIVRFPDWALRPDTGIARIASDLGWPAGTAETLASAVRRRFCGADLHCRAAGPGDGLMAEAAALFETLTGEAVSDGGLDRAARATRPALERAQAFCAPLDRYRLAEIGIREGSTGEGFTAPGTMRLTAELALAEQRAWALAKALTSSERAADRAARRFARESARSAGRLAALRRQVSREAGEGLAALSAAARTRADLRVRLRAATALAAREASQRQATEDRLADSRQRLEAALRECAALREDRNRLAGRADELAQLCQKEMVTVIRPLYRRFYRAGGTILRQVLSPARVERIKRALPHPDGIPGALTLVIPTAGVARECEVPARDVSIDKPDIFILSIINWDFRTQRPQHLAREFAARGHRVFYLEMEAGDGGTAIRSVAPGVWAVRLSGQGIGFLRPYSGRPSGAQVAAWLDNFNAFCDRIGTSPWRHVVIEHPFWWPLARNLPPENRITFDCMDEISGFSNTEDHILAAEEEMVAGCDRLIVSSDYLMARRGRSRPAALVRNGADIGHFTGHPTTPLAERIAARLRGGCLRVGYVGAIAEWFDDDLLAEVARLAPDIDFHLCGAVTAPGVLRLADLPNVSLHGEIAYAEVPAFLGAMDVMMIPFRLLPIIAACDPVKFYEYAAAMRPTVATAMPELRRAGDLVRIAHTAGEFAQALREAGASADPLQGERLRTYALANTWSERATAMLAEMDRAPLVSVVILAWGDAALTMTAVHALLGEGRVYPALEVIVVDNGSPPEECGRLAAYLSRFPEARLIENGANLGFAAGNNVGIQAATGDYVLLLNNDTYMAPGAIWAMVGQLERTPQIGVVGPLTNNIGNEARVAVDYADMEQMRRAARRLTQGFRGRWTPLPVVAYFCAMFRRADLARFGPLDPVYGRGMFEDDDHCAVIRAQGFDCALAEDAFVHHHLSASFARVEPAERIERFDANRRTYEGRWGPWTPHRYRASRPAPDWEAA